MSNEFLPEITLQAKMEAYPDSDDDSELVTKVNDPVSFPPPGDQYYQLYLVLHT
jgi:hypothetical protein